MLAGTPDREIQVPDTVRILTGQRDLRCVWENALGGLTFAVAGVGDSRVIKWAPIESGIDLREEGLRISWAAPFTAVPVVIDSGSDDTGTWLMTDAIPAENAVSSKWKNDPAVAVAAIGEGLRAFHDAVPVEECPFSWSAEDRARDAVHRAAEGRMARATWHEEHQQLSVSEALAFVSSIPPTDRLVVCHGDACAPNTLIDEYGHWCAHVDLGSLGIADRWADLAIATWSTIWNYGPGFEELLLSAYGISADPERSHYYRLLWDLGP